MALALPLRRLAPADRYVGWVVAALAAFGAVVVYSAVSYLAETKAGGDELGLLGEYLMRLALAGVLAVGVSRLDYRKAASVARPVLVVLSAIVPLLDPLWASVGLVLTVAGFVLLVLRQPRRRHPYDGDDGARV